MAPLKIAVIGHLRYPIAPPFLGGMEAHCHQLVRALAARGHRVILFASGDSDPALPLWPIIARHYERDLPWSGWRDTDRLRNVLGEAFARAWAEIRGGSFDIVHNNAMHPALHAWARRDGQPMVTSLHVPPFDALAEAVRGQAAPWLRQTATSRAHLRSWWESPPATAAVVHNGVDIARWAFQPQGNGRAIWAGRITPNKGTALALDAARAAGIALDLIGPIDCPDYHAGEVVPRLDDRRVYHGLKSGPELAAMIGAASVLVATPLWDEPFGLVVTEAMACGVPVAALDRGAMREVAGPCGIMATDAESLAAAIREAMNVPRARCRERVERLFSMDAMIGGYERAYAAAMVGARASSCASKAAELA